uniref:Ig-like domain-containing protein n=1 Tax=Gopherus evgoodei TaxID=1825980 RepID=A0A8C4YS93_9SAUR
MAVCCCYTKVLFPLFDGFSCILFIFSGNPTAPSVFPLVPCCTKTGNAPLDTSLACLVTGYLPSPVEIKWNSGKVTQGVTTFPEVTVSNGRFTQSSLLIIPARPRQVLKHIEPWCFVSADLLPPPSPQRLLLPPPGVSNCNQHPLEVSLLPPSLEDLYIAQNASIRCLVSGMETPGSLEVSWNRGSGGPLAVVSRDPVLQEDGTYSVTSILPVCVEEWQAGEEFTCTMKHQDFPSAIPGLWIPILSINPLLFLMAVVSLRAPSVYISPPHTEELALQESATITSLASGFRPRDILVTWTQQDRPVPQEAYTNVGPVREAGKKERYFIYSKVNEGLPMTFIHRSVDKASGKPTVVNVSVILSDTDVTCY